MEPVKPGMCSICGEKMDEKHSDKQCFAAFRKKSLDQMPEHTAKERFIKKVAKLGFFKLLSISLVTFIIIPQFLLFILYSLFKDALATDVWTAINISVISINLWTWSLAIFIGWWGERARVAVTHRRMIEKEKKTTVEEIFLLTTGGRLIKHYTRRLKPDMDVDILGGMLVAVQEFVNDSFRGQPGSLDEIKFGELGIKIGRGKYLIMAAIISGIDHEEIFKKIIGSIEKMEKKYSNVLEKWDGNLDNVRGLDDYIKDIIAGSYKY